MIYLLRHGETVWNCERRIQGHLDSPLTSRGCAQAQALGRLLARELADPGACRLVSSPLGRAWQSAVLVAEALGLEPRVIALEPRLMELNFGSWEGLLWDEVADHDPEGWRLRSADRWHFTAPGGESYAGLAVRARAWLEEVEAVDDGGPPVIALCHGGTSRIVRGLYAGLDREATLDQPQPQERLYRLAGGRIDELAGDS
jgi:broad specificity phosphatase PhoE